MKVKIKNGTIGRGSMHSPQRNAPPSFSRNRVSVARSRSRSFRPIHFNKYLQQIYEEYIFKGAYHHIGAYLNTIKNLIDWGMPKHPVYTANVPLQRLVLPQDHHSGGWHQHLPARDRRQINLSPHAPAWGFTLHEDFQRWFIEFRDYSNEQEVSFLFSDEPWGDFCHPDPTVNWERIENANKLSGSHLEVIENMLKHPTNQFKPHLKIGGCPNFFKEVELPFVDLFCDWHLNSLLESLEKQCIFWNDPQLS